MTTSPTQGEHAQPEALRPKFGDLLRNTMASDSNPRRDAYFIREVHRSGGGVNPGRWFEMTDGNGETWLSNPQNMVPAAPAQPAAPQGGAYAELPTWWSKFIQGVCEITDRSSPEDEPDAIVATPDELAVCAINAIEGEVASHGQAPAATVIKKGADRQWMSERLGHLPDGIYSLYLAPTAQAAPAATPKAGSVTAPAVDDFQPCSSCFGTGVEGDADDYGRTIDVTCGECNGSGRAQVKEAIRTESVTSRYRDACTQGGRCLGGCLSAEPCYLAARATAQPAPAATPQAEPLHITHGPLMRHAAALLRSRKPVLPDHESVAAELEMAADGHPTPAGDPSPEWLEVGRIAMEQAPQADSQPAAMLLSDEELCQIEEPYLLNFRIPLGGQYDFARAVEKAVICKMGSAPAPKGETNAQLDIDSNNSAPGQQRDVAGSVALGQPMGNGQDQAAGHSGAQGDKLLIVAERNIRSFLRSAIFKCESDREAALSCVDVLRDAARAQADSVPAQQDACRRWA